ncbi:MAG: DnaB-like helicase C-terminal domain-containing protein [bacterium]
MEATHPVEDLFNEAMDFDSFLNEEFGAQEDISNKQKTKKPQDKDEEDIEKLIVKPSFDRNLLDHEQIMVQTIEKVDRKSWERGEGLKTSYEILNEKLNGIQPGLGFVGGESNMGKSGYLLSIAYNTPQVDNAYSIYFSNDDSAADLLPRVISADKKIPINSIRLPTTYEKYPKILERRKKGMEEVYNLIDKFKIIDQDRIYSEPGIEEEKDSIKNIETIEKVIKQHYNYFREQNIDKKIFVQIDSFHDLESSVKNFRSDKEKYSYLSTKLKDLAEELDIPIWCTGELKKLGGERRPIKEDLREANKIIYKASLILMVYNEVGVEQSNAEIFFRTPEKPGKQPIFEVDFVKNKLSEFKGRLYYEFLTDYALYTECLPEDMEKYNNLIYSQ